jgi:UDP-N-acetylmuramate--alanine ligase
MSKINLSGKPFHFIGIGGIGMSALAYILAKRELPVSGSDIRTSHITERLEALGANIFTSQTAENIAQINLKNNFSGGLLASKDSLPQIICSTAINHQNLEYQAAIDQGYPIYHRSDLLAALIQDYQSIAVAGTHGKTTTSSLISYLLFKSGLDPTVIIGGEVNAWEGNARLGNSPYLVAEADESDGSLVKHHPRFGIITNIELDHPDHYESLEQLVGIFQQFANQSEIVVACGDCPIVKDTIKADLTYSLDPKSSADYIAINIVHGAYGTEAEILENGVSLGHLSLQLSGDHNLSNALAAIAIGRQLGLEFNIIAEALASFEGAKRRFEYKGNYQGATLIDDYAHHPSEISCTLQAGQSRLAQYNAQRLVAIFQPHRYSRTAAFIEEFAQCFNQADIVIVTDIYSAGEVNCTEVNGETVVNTLKKYHNQVYYQPNLSQLPDFLANFLQPQDLTIFLGAGNLNQTIPQLLNLKQKSLAKVA